MYYVDQDGRRVLSSCQPQSPEIWRSQGAVRSDTVLCRMMGTFVRDDAFPQCIDDLAVANAESHQ
jgi:hypothetical protein